MAIVKQNGVGQRELPSLCPQQWGSIRPSDAKRSAVEERPREGIDLHAALWPQDGGSRVDSKPRLCKLRCYKQSEASHVIA